MINDNRMIYPPIPELTEKGKYNRYELVIAVAKGARAVTSEYLEMRENTERMINDRETDKPLLSLIDSEYRDEKAVRIAISRIHEGKYRIRRPGEAGAEEASEEAPEEA